MNTSPPRAAAQPEAISEAPLPAPVHEFIVRVADRGPSTRALAIVSVAGVALFVVSLLALPRKAPPLTDSIVAAPTDPTTPARAAEPVAAVERPPEPTLPSRAMSPRPPATSLDPAPAAAVVTPAVAAGAPLARAEAPRPDVPARVVNAPGVPDAPRGDLMPVGATSGAPIDLVVAPPPPARVREASGDAPIVPVVSTPRAEQPAPKAVVEQRSESASGSTTE